MTTIILDMHDKIVVVVIFIADSSSADYLTQTDYCDLEMTGLPFGRTEFEIAVPKN
jgi:hypothetical protein